MRKNLCFSICFLTCVLFCAGAKAAEVAWTGASNDLWTVDENWLGGTGPTNAGDSILFSGLATTNLSTTLGQDYALTNLTVGAPSGPVTISGNTLTLGAAGIDMSAAAQDLTLNSAIVLGSNQTWTVAAGRMLSANEAISEQGGNWGITKSGDGTMVLSSSGGVANAYSGTTIVDAGVLAVGGGFGGDGAIQGDINVNAGATFRMQQVNIIANDSLMTVNQGGVSDFNGHTESLGALLGDGSIVNMDSPITIDNLPNGQDRVFSGTLTGTSTLRLRREGGVASGGTQSLNGTNQVASFQIQGNNKLHFGGTGHTVCSGTILVNTGGGLDNAQLIIDGSHELTALRIQVQEAAGHKGQVYQNGGTVTLTDSNGEEGALRLGHWAGDTSTYFMNAGSSADV